VKTKEYVENMCTLALNSVKGDQIEVCIRTSRREVTRFANSIIHQNMAEEVDEFKARVILGKKIGSVGLRCINEDRITKGMYRAYELAKHQKEDPDFHTLPKVAPIEEIEEIHPVSPEERAECVEKVVKIAKKYDLEAAGTVSTHYTTLGVFNSLGVRSIGRTERVSLTMTLMSQDSSGFASASAKEFSLIEPQALAEVACEKAIKSRNPTKIAPGKYNVLLEPQAVAELLAFLSYIGFGARAYQEGRSFMKIGQKITGENITIIDDSYHPKTLGFHFDYEGVPKQKVVLIENGVAKNVVYDSYYAHKEGKKSTGHAIPQPNIYGPHPWNIILTPGTHTKEEMINSIDEGILVTRFWYTRVIDPDKTLITGMTRDGTFLIKNGKIEKGIKNMRYTINILETLENVIKISNESVLIESSVVPSLLIKDFNFSGTTEY
jgi:predicted Zn-dependent protease